jgi:hypothetical protein
LVLVLIFVLGLVLIAVLIVLHLNILLRRKNLQDRLRRNTVSRCHTGDHTYIMRKKSPAIRGAFEKFYFLFAFGA